MALFLSLSLSETLFPGVPFSEIEGEAFKPHKGSGVLLKGKSHRYGYGPHGENVLYPLSSAYSVARRMSEGLVTRRRSRTPVKPFGSLDDHLQAMEGAAKDLAPYVRELDRNIWTFHRTKTYWVPFPADEVPTDHPAHFRFLQRGIQAAWTAWNGRNANMRGEGIYSAQVPLSKPGYGPYLLGFRLKKGLRFINFSQDSIPISPKVQKLWQKRGCNLYNYGTDVGAVSTSPCRLLLLGTLRALGVSFFGYGYSQGSIRSCRTGTALVTIDPLAVGPEDVLGFYGVKAKVAAHHRPHYRAFEKLGEMTNRYGASSWRNSYPLNDIPKGPLLTEALKPFGCGPEDIPGTGYAKKVKAYLTFPKRQDITQYCKQEMGLSHHEGLNELLYHWENLERGYGEDE